MTMLEAIQSEAVYQAGSRNVEIIRRLIAGERVRRSPAISLCKYQKLKSRITGRVAFDPCNPYDYGWRHQRTLRKKLSYKSPCGLCRECIATSG